MKIGHAKIAGLPLTPLWILLATSAGWAGDWPQFLGPGRNGVAPGIVLAETWPKEGPPLIWQKRVGQGFSGPVVAEGNLVLFSRVGDKEVIECLDAKTGRAVWQFAYPTAYVDDFGFDPGPRATPAVAGGRVWCFGAEGMLHCLDFPTGAKIWSVDTKGRFHAPKGFFGAACSPLVEGDAVLLNIGGGDGAGIVAFDRATGKVLWQATSDEPSYSSPAAATINGRRYAFFLTRRSFVGLDPASGKIHFQIPFEPPVHDSVTAATPLVDGDLVFISASYGTGAEVLRVKDPRPEKLWSSDDVLSNHYATSVCHDGFLFGIDGRTDPGMEPGPSLRCVELRTGKIRWQEGSVGAATLMLADGHLLILTEQGELIRAPASPDGFKPDGRAQILPFQVRAYPALADGLFYARSKDKLVCVDLAGAKDGAGGKPGAPSKP